MTENTNDKTEDMSTESKNQAEDNKGKILALVKSPIDLVKKDFDTFFEGIENCIPQKVLFGTNLTIPLPNNVILPTKKLNLFFLGNVTYAYEIFSKGKNEKTFLTVKKVINGIPEKMSLQLLISNNRTEEKPIAEIGLVFRMESGTLSKPIILDNRAKSRVSEFILAVNKSNNRLQFNLDDRTFLLLMEYINASSPQTTLSFKNAGRVKYQNFSGRLYKNAYLDSAGIIESNTDGTVKVGNQMLKLDNKIKDSLPELYLGEVNVPELLNEMLGQIDKIFKGRFDIFLMLGASIMVTVIDDIWKNLPGFPVIYLYGATKQGKSLLQGVISNIFGYSNKNVSMGNSTDNAIAMKCHRANAIPVLINDFDLYKAKGVGFENNVVQFYEGGIREKMYDGSVMNRMPINTTAIFSSNYMPNDKPKVFNRLLPFYFPDNCINTTAITDGFNNDLKRSRIVAEFIKFSPSAILDTIKKTEDWMLSKKLFQNKDRESNNVAIAFTGLLYLNQIANYKIDNYGEKLKQYCDWYNSLFSELNTPVEKFLRAFVTLAVKKNDMKKNDLKKDVHFKVKFKDGKLYLTFALTECLKIYNKYVMDSFNTADYIDHRTFGLDLSNSKYFVSKGAERYKYDLAHSYTLDITKHEITPYLSGFWAKSIEEIQQLK